MMWMKIRLMNVFHFIVCLFVNFNLCFQYQGQLMAFEWIEENLSKFGGDLKKVTLLGHGQMGVFNSFYHLLSPKTKSKKL